MADQDIQKEPPEGTPEGIPEGIQKEPPRAEAAPVLPGPPDAAANPFRRRGPLWVQRIFNKRSLITVAVVVGLLIAAMIGAMKWDNSRPVQVQVSGHVVPPEGRLLFNKAGDGPFLLVSFRPLDDPANSKLTTQIFVQEPVIRRLGEEVSINGGPFTLMCPPGRYKVILIEPPLHPFHRNHLFRDLDEDSSPPRPPLGPLDMDGHPSDDDNPDWYVYRKRYRDVRLTPWIVTVPKEGLKDLALEAED